MDAVQLGGVQIEYLDQRKENKSFVLEIISATFLEKQNATLSLVPGLENYLFIHGILNRTEVLIVSNDGMLCVYLYESFMNMHVCMYICMPSLCMYLSNDYTLL